MSIREKICEHKPGRQIKTAHGLFCLDCGHLASKPVKNKSVTQHSTKIKLSSTPLKTVKVTASGLISTHHTARVDVATSKNVKISMADIRPSKPKAN